MARRHPRRAARRLDVAPGDLFGHFRVVLVRMVDRWQPTVDHTSLIYPA
jgi:hypothetical protein